MAATASSYRLVTKGLRKQYMHELQQQFRHLYRHTPSGLGRNSVQCVCTISTKIASAAVQFQAAFTPHTTTHTCVQRHH